MFLRFVTINIKDFINFIKKIYIYINKNIFNKNKYKVLNNFIKFQCEYCRIIKMMTGIKKFMKIKNNTIIINH